MRQRGARLTALPSRHARTMRSLPTGPVEDSSSALFPVGRRGPYPGRTNPVGGLRMAQVYSHAPVLVDEVVRLLSTVPSGVVIDGTWGVAATRPRSSSGATTSWCSASTGIPTRSSRRAAGVERFGGRAVLRQARFATMAQVLDGAQGDGAISAAAPVTGVLLDLGVSSHQLDDLRARVLLSSEGPLDMRMGPDDGPTAAEFLRDVDEDTLTELLVANGERRFASWDRQVDPRLVAREHRRARGRRRASGPAAARRHGHVASRTFQALRIAVNEELDELLLALERREVAPRRGRSPDRDLVPLRRGHAREVDASRRGHWRLRVPAPAALRVRRRPEHAAGDARRAQGDRRGDRAQPAIEECAASCRGAARRGGVMTPPATATARTASEAPPRRAARPPLRPVTPAPRPAPATRWSRVRRRREPGDHRRQPRGREPAGRRDRQHGARRWPAATVTAPSRGRAVRGGAGRGRGARCLARVAGGHRPRHRADGPARAPRRRSSIPGVSVARPLRPPTFSSAPCCSLTPGR